MKQKSGLGKAPAVFCGGEDPHCSGWTDRPSQSGPIGMLV